jgi:V8-like Glu-specific endopeptidase
LLNNTKKDHKPYFLTANHCIAKQSEAATVDILWNHRAASCNSFQADSTRVRQKVGAQLLYSSRKTDTSLLLLNSKPPSTAVFAGWNANSPAGVGATVFSIHHPNGDFQMSSSGVVSGFYTSCSSEGDCGALLSQAGNNPLYAVKWSRGITAHGSSGGPLFSSSTGQVIGQLRGGHSSCTTPNAMDSFGRFDLPFKDGMWKWLSPSN